MHKAKRLTRFDIVLFLATAGSILLFFLLSDYHVFSPLSRVNVAEVDRRADSVFTRHGYTDPEKSILKAPYAFATELSALVQFTGLNEFRHLAEREGIFVPHIMVTVAANDNFHFSLGSKDAIVSPSSNDDGNIDSSMKVWFDARGSIIGRYWIDSTKSLKDSEKLARRIMEEMPTAIAAVPLSRWVKKTNGRRVSWTYDVRQIGDLVERYRIVVTGVEIDKKITLSQEWLKYYVLVTPKGPEKTQLLEILSFLTFALIIITSLTLFVVQVRRHSVSIWLIILPTISTALYFAVTSMAMVSVGGRYFVLLVTFFMISLVAFLMIGMPFASIVSLFREAMPEKFYSWLRLFNRPLKSYYVGRSLVHGLCASIISMSIFPLSFWLLSLVGLDSILMPMVLSENQALMAIYPQILIVGSLGFIPWITLGLLLFFPAVAGRFIPKPYDRYVGLVGILFSNTALSLMQADAAGGVIVLSLVGAVLYFVMIYRTDYLAMAVFTLMSSIFFIGLAQPDNLMVGTFVLLSGLTVLVFGVAAYSRVPEKINEDDYKPEYLIALEEQRRMREELGAAKIVQRKLLPAIVPKTHTLDIAATCLPAFEVGGDYYDFFPLSENQLGIMVGDVSGKGMSAAFYITLAKGVIVSQINEADSPALVLHRVNRLLYQLVEKGKFLSLIYGVLNTETGRFVFAHAGHNPLIVRRANRQGSHYVRQRGMALGLNQGSLFEEVTTNNELALSDGDVLVLYTDGVTEAMNESELDFGEDRLLALVEKGPEQADELLQHITSALKDYIGKAKQWDDITIVVVRYRGQVAEVARLTME